MTFTVPGSGATDFLAVPFLRSKSFFSIEAKIFPLHSHTLIGKDKNQMHQEPTTNTGKTLGKHLRPGYEIILFKRHVHLLSGITLPPPKRFG